MGGGDREEGHALPFATTDERCLTPRVLSAWRSPLLERHSAIDDTMNERTSTLLLALAKMRLLRTSDIARLSFGAVGTAQKRLRKLHDAGLVRAVRVEHFGEQRFVLTRAGYTQLADVFERQDLPPFADHPLAGVRSLEHLDLLNRYRIALATSVAMHDIELVAFVSSWERPGGAPLAGVVPDAVVRLAVGEHVVTLALTIDPGRAPPTQVRRKVARYAALLRRPASASAAPFPLLMTVNARRARSLARALGDAMSTQVLLGAPPFVLEDGGLRRGLAIPDALAQVVGALSEDDFGQGLLALFRPRAERGRRPVP
jgi:hypothetical protein